MRELSRKLAVAWRCAAGGQKLLAATVLVVLLGGVFVAAHRGSGSARHPLARAAVEEPVPLAPTPTQPVASVVPTQAPTSVAPPPPVTHSPASTPTTAAPTTSSGLETASAPDSAAARACATFRATVEPVIRQAVQDDDLEPAAALLRAASDPQSPWSQLTSAVTLAAMRSPQLQQHITLLGRDIVQSDPSLSLTGLGSDLDAVDVDCGVSPG